MKTYELLNKYVSFITSRRSAGTVAMRQCCFRQFTKHYGDVPIGKVNHGMVYELCPTDGKLRLMIHSLSAAFHWAVKCGLAAKNPLVGIETPSGRSRSRDCLITPSQHEAILMATDNTYTTDFRDFIIALENTGARPGEIAAATAAAFSAADGAIVYHGRTRLMRSEHRHKNSGKDRERVIMLTGEALELVRKLARRHAAGGVLFRNRHGHAWNECSWGRAFTVLSQRLRLPHLIAYSYRHTFATRLLLAGMPVEVLANLMGNSPEILHKHYAHLLADRAGLRAQLEAFRQAPGTGGRSLRCADSP